MVAIATVADMVPLLGENRNLVYYGLKVLNKTARPGLLSFYRRLKLSAPNIKEDDLNFMIAPRLNVAGRMDHATVSFNFAYHPIRTGSGLDKRKIGSDEWRQAGSG